MISQTAFDRYVNDFTELASELDVKTIEELRKIANRLIDNPDLDFNRRIQSFSQEETNKWKERALNAIYASLPVAYLRGITSMDSELKRLTTPKPANRPLAPIKFPRQAQILGEASDKAKETLRNYPKHWTAYSRFENTFSRAVDQAVLPYYRSTLQNYRRISEMAMVDTFRNGDKATRVSLAQDIMDEFSSRGIKTATFPSGHRMSIQAFAEREARSYTQKVAVQGQLNRYAERGYDLVRISAYAGPSPMCAPHQGKVYSNSGNSDQYPPLDEAIFSGSYTYGGGIFHDYCGHSTSAYIPGVSESINITDSPEEQRILNNLGERKGNKYIYDKRQQLRNYEYQVRANKRKMAGALNKAERMKYKRSVSNYQAKIREQLDEYPFLRRRRDREQI